MSCRVEVYGSYYSVAALPRWPTSLWDSLVQAEPSSRTEQGHRASFWVFVGCVSARLSHALASPPPTASRAQQESVVASLSHR